MAADTLLRNQILRRIQKIPVEKLKELNEYVSRLEKTMDRKEKILSFAGSWGHIDDELFEEFTDNLIVKRERNKRRNEQSPD